MNEILFKIIILRYLDSNEKLFNLEHDIYIIIEIPKGFINFEKKFKILNLFKKICLKNLTPLRLEPNSKTIRSSPISIVSEVLTLYEKGKIGKNNIDLDAPIKISAKNCEKIINKYFNVENKNYYQKMNFIKIYDLILLYLKEKICLFYIFLLNLLFLNYHYIFMTIIFLLLQI